MEKRSVLLKVSDTSGKRIMMNVARSSNQVVITVPYLKEVAKDKPPFAKKGLIEIEVLQRNYTKTKNMLTKYLEDLFLKELNSADTDTGHGRGSNTGRTKKKLTTGSNEKAGGKDSSPVRDSGRGDKPTESVGNGVSVSDMAKSDSKSSGSSS